MIRCAVVAAFACIHPALMGYGSLRAIFLMVQYYTLIWNMKSIQIEYYLAYIVV